ncbi:alpha/beta hydrolase [Aneurinibacillus thermoaerophilus]|uniref:alpha/beta fold hydrolase n=1 Tax=Aneurinibacillus thermoaerophilus TaxID=143495 RepID=UPI002E2216BF|nr:alpha/beta hydrolase [Aneurinibacillus thermoaerophilus]MED0764310.1 alpha/beta hydrolase [Aneurinibacillus thermoaerophilus]
MPHLNIQNVPLYYEEEGRGFPVVFLHGMGLSHANWRGQIQHFSKKFRVITYDMRGHGRSGISHRQAPETYLEVLSRDLQLMLEHLGIQKAHFVAYSTGTLVLLHFLRDFSHMCERAVLTGAFPCLSDAYMYTKVGASYLLTLLHASRYEARKVAQANGATSRQVDLFMNEALKARRSEMLVLLRALVTCDLTSFLPNVNIPTLLIYGGNEWYMRKYRHMMLTSLPQAEVCLIPKTSHACPTKACQVFNMLVEDFLTGEGMQCGKTVE